MFGQGLNFGGIAGGGGPIDLQYLIVGGGGVGGFGVKDISVHPANSGASCGGGGGAGETLVATSTFNIGTQYTITIGSSDTDSSIVGADITTITGLKGGKGGGNETQGSGRFASYSMYNNAGADKNGACGGGGGTSQSTSATGGTASKGFAGGNWNRAGDYNPNRGAGGGGMGAVGGNNVTPGNNGGVGVTTTLFSSSTATTASIGQVSGGSVYFSGGGGGAIRSFTKGYGGLGGGGNGNSFGYSAGSGGSANTGGGGGGGDKDNAFYSSCCGPYGGGSGVVVFKVPTSSYSGTVTGSPTVIVEGSDTILIFKASGTYTV